MALQYSVAVRNARLDVVETTVRPANSSPTPPAILELRSGEPPASCATADSGTMLAQIVLPEDWMAAASGGTKAKSGTWAGVGAANGTVGHFRIKEGTSPDTTHVQGTVGATGSPTYDMTVDNVSISSGQTITISTFTLTAGNA
jgi:hypothetical protein